MSLVALVFLFGLGSEKELAPAVAGPEPSLTATLAIAPRPRSSPGGAVVPSVLDGLRSSPPALEVEEEPGGPLLAAGRPVALDGSPALIAATGAWVPVSRGGTESLWFLPRPGHHYLVEATPCVDTYLFERPPVSERPPSILVRVAGDRPLALHGTVEAGLVLQPGSITAVGAADSANCPRLHRLTFVVPGGEAWRMEDQVCSIAFFTLGGETPLVTCDPLRQSATIETSPPP